MRASISAATGEVDRLDDGVVGEVVGGISRRDRFHLRFPEGALEVVEGHLTRTQRALQHLVDECPGGLRRALDGRSRIRRVSRERHLLEERDEIAVVALRLRALAGLELGEDRLDPVDGAQRQADGVGRHPRALAELAHQGLGRVCERFEPRQAEETAGALDGVDEAEDVVEDPRVVGFLFELHELDVDDVETFVRLGQELAQKIVHVPLPEPLPGPFSTGRRGHARRGVPDVTGVSDQKVKLG
jgi:hypothetical protein